MLSAAGLRAETIAVDGHVHQNATMKDVGEPGIIYETSEGGLVVVPWSEINEFQRTTVKTRFSDAIENARLKAIWIDGTVFENHKDGIIVQVSLDLSAGEDSEEGEEGKEDQPTYRDGGEIASGMVIITDLKDSAIKKPGDPVSGIFYKEGTFTYEMAGFNLIKEIHKCTQALPEWARERGWTNREGNQLRAKVIAVRDGKCLFKQGERTFPYEIANLSDEDQALIAKFEARSREIPVF